MGFNVAIMTGIFKFDTSLEAKNIRTSLGHAVCLSSNAGADSVVYVMMEKARLSQIKDH